MDYVTVAKLQGKLEGGANQTTVRKLIEKMARDGFLEAKTNRRLGLCCQNNKFTLFLALVGIKPFIIYCDRQARDPFWSN